MLCNADYVIQSHSRKVRGEPDSIKSLIELFKSHLKTAHYCGTIVGAKWKLCIIWFHINMDELLEEASEEANEEANEEAGKLLRDQRDLNANKYHEYHPERLFAHA